MENQEDMLTRNIIGCGFEVFNVLGYGFLESVYHKSMQIELENKGLKFDSERPLQVDYKGEIVGNYFADLIVEDSVIIEIKSVRKIELAHEIQLVNYLAATNIDTGLILNFSDTGLKIKRKVKSLKTFSDAIPHLWNALKGNSGN